MNGKKDYADEHEFMGMEDSEKWRLVWAILRDIQDRLETATDDTVSSTVRKAWVALPTLASVGMFMAIMLGKR